MIERKVHPININHSVIGNDAGDADSIISAIALAYIGSMYYVDRAQKYPKRSGTTPIVSPPKDSFTYESPEVRILLELAGIDDTSDKLIFIDDIKDMLENDNKDTMPSHSLSLVEYPE